MVPDAGERRENDDEGAFDGDGERLPQRLLQGRGQFPRGGRLPADLKRGVLSEDGIYDLLEDDRALLVRLLETAADTLRRG